MLDGTGNSCHLQSPFQFFLNEVWTLQQFEDLTPYDLIKKILSYWLAITYRPAKGAPCVGAEATIVVDCTCTCPRRSAIKTVAAFAARHQALHDAGRDCATRRAIFVRLKPLCGQCKGLLSDNRWDRNLDPFLSWPLVVGAVPRCESASQTDWPRDALSLRRLRFVEACRSLVRRIAQHSPNHRTLPTRDSLACRNALFVQ